MKAKLILEDQTTMDAESFGAPISSAGEVVFSTGMMGYPEGLTDPSYQGQILTLTYPLVGNYGVPDKSLWEAKHLMVSGLIVSQYIDTPSHFQSKRTLAEWFRDEQLPLIQIKDTRFITKHIREKGSMLGKIVIDKDVEYYDPDKENLVAKVSTEEVQFFPAKGLKTIVLIDCGAKNTIIHSLTKRNINVLVIPWNFPLFEKTGKDQLAEFMPKRKGNSLFDALVISNGPGDPTSVLETKQTIALAMEKNIPTLGICLGHQLLSLAAGGGTGKLKYGHRSQNQPCILEGTNRCYITTQNHGFAVTEIPPGFKKWFTNANDQSNEGIIHNKKPFMSVQFHPEATPGPYDTEWIFDYFLEKVKT